ncbi:MAG: hypothetical protein MUF54_06620 [Polyangiaceae bacterium]|nr:hypothetical protein [Polyangiaceae bacterium]
MFCRSCEVASMGIPKGTIGPRRSTTGGDSARFYGMARRSATECGVILDACRATDLADLELLSKGRTRLVRTVAMLTAIVLRLHDPGSGST